MFLFFFVGYNSSLAACKTTRSKKSCKFPFLYRGVSQHSCLMLDPSQPSGFWCSVANFPNGTVRAWDTCNNQCPTSSNQGKDFLYNMSTRKWDILVFFCKQVLNVSKIQSFQTDEWSRDEYWMVVLLSTRE